MRVLLDECLPVRLERELADHQVSTAREIGLAGKNDGVLLDFACAYFDVLVTIDQGALAQERFAGRNVGVITLQARSNSFAALAPLLSPLRRALTAAAPGQVLALGI
jgi:predicted nuclease of predicted toxin-antitoxin system